MPNSPIYLIALDVPIAKLWEYLPLDDKPIAMGARVWVPFGRQKKVGLVVDSTTQGRAPAHKLKAIFEVIDHDPIIDASLLTLLHWTSSYYHSPQGEVILRALPKRLRQGKPAIPKLPVCYRITPAGRDANPRGKQQQKILQQLLSTPTISPQDDLSLSKTSLQSLCDKGWVEQMTQAPSITATTTMPPLTPEQQRASAQVKEKFGQFAVFLLDGVTGSGKTEVYAKLITACVAQQKSVLLLVPEIALTPQTQARLAKYLSVPVYLLHSRLSDGARHLAWYQAQSGPCVCLGTRSAVFTPMPDLGLIIIDEEHDSSYKQLDGCRLHARDVAIMRANQCDIPIVLGSATPSLESLHNVLQGKYQHLQLLNRPNQQQLPSLSLIDHRPFPKTELLAPPLVQAMGEHLKKGNQVMLFLNRRGFAPIYMCFSCQHIEHCQRCDAYLTFHHHQHQLLCHHCGAKAKLAPQCSQCASIDLGPVGAGTEQVEQVVSALFGQYTMVRLDKDTLGKNTALETKLAQIQRGEAQIIIGTQILAKGHDFANLTLVGMLGIDNSLYCHDHRALEQMGQILTQVAGRAGRHQPGEVLIQTHHPSHPLLNLLVNEGYGAFANQLLAERQEMGLPPYQHQAILRAESTHEGHAKAFFGQIIKPGQGTHPIQLLGPVPALMAKKQGLYRYQMLIECPSRMTLKHYLSQLCLHLNGGSHRVRWSIDTDPIEA